MHEIQRYLWASGAKVSITPVGSAASFTGQVEAVEDGCFTMTGNWSGGDGLQLRVIFVTANVSHIRIH